MRAASKNCFDCIPLLISELKIQDKKGNCALHYACENDCPQAAALLLDESNIKNKKGNDALFCACKNECFESANIIQNKIYTELQNGVEILDEQIRDTINLRKKEEDEIMRIITVLMGE